MTTTLRIDDQLKRDCDEVFEELGLTLTSAVNVFLRQVVRSRSIPFIIGMREESRRAKEAFDAIRADIKARNLPEMSMDEINAEISLARKERRARKAQEAWAEMRAQVQAEYKDKPEPTLDEINEMIAGVRRARRERTAAAREAVAV